MAESAAPAEDDRQEAVRMLAAEVKALREVLALYGDRSRMTHAPAHLRDAIDRALAADLENPRPFRPFGAPRT